MLSFNHLFDIRTGNVSDDEAQDLHQMEDCSVPEALQELQALLDAYRAGAVTENHSA